MGPEGKGGGGGRGKGGKGGKTRETVMWREGWRSHGGSPEEREHSAREGVMEGR